MPKKPIDYSNCCIYKIQHIEKEDLVYVGHTTNFTKRKCQHKGSCNNDNDQYHNLKVYHIIRQNGGWDSFKMLEVEKYPCNNKREAERRENGVMKELQASLNNISSYVSEDEKKEKGKIQRKDYYDNNKDSIREWSKLYRDLNKERLKDYKKKYYDTNKDRDKTQRKEYRESNKDRLRESKKRSRTSNEEMLKKKNKQYRDLNKETIQAKKKNTMKRIKN